MNDRFSLAFVNTFWFPVRLKLLSHYSPSLDKSNISLHSHLTVTVACEWKCGGKYQKQQCLFFAYSLLIIFDEYNAYLTQNGSICPIKVICFQPTSCHFVLEFVIPCTCPIFMYTFCFQKS